MRHRDSEDEQDDNVKDFRPDVEDNPSRRQDRQQTPQIMTNAGNVDLDAFEADTVRVYWRPAKGVEFWADVRQNFLTSEDLADYTKELRDVRYNNLRIRELENKQASISEDDEQWREYQDEIEELEENSSEMNCTLTRIWIPLVVDHNLERGGRKVENTIEAISTLVPLTVINGLASEILKLITEGKYRNRAAGGSRRSRRGSKRRR